MIGAGQDENRDGQALCAAIWTGSGRTSSRHQFLREQIATVLKVEPAAIELERPLQDLGLDSLTAFELKNCIEIELGVALPVGKFLQRPTTQTSPPRSSRRSIPTAAVLIDPVDSDGPG